MLEVFFRVPIKNGCIRLTKHLLKVDIFSGKENTEKIYSGEPQIGQILFNKRLENQHATHSSEDHIHATGIICEISCFLRIDNLLGAVWE